LNLGANGYTIEAWIKPTLSSLQTTSRIVASSMQPVNIVVAHIGDQLALRCVAQGCRAPAEERGSHAFEK
jgi:hypothetical protein